MMTPAMTTPVQNGTATRVLRIEPLDPLFFRDGRPFGAELAGQTVAAPLPQTFAGALRTHLLKAAGCDFTELNKHQKGMSFSVACRELGNEAIAAIGALSFSGPFYCITEKGGAVRVLLPVPATLQGPKKGKDGNKVLLRPLAPEVSLPGWKSPLPDAPDLRPLWHMNHEPVESLSGTYVTSEGMKKLLRGEVPDNDELKKGKDLYDFDHRTGIGVDETSNTAAESQIYSARFLALKSGVGFMIGVTGPQAALDLLRAGDVLPLGGEARYARVASVEAKRLFDGLSQQPPKVQSDEVAFATLVQPGLFGGWCPAELRGKLLAAAVPGHVAVSGWDLARGGPKPTRFAVAAGSVYFLKPEAQADIPTPSALGDDTELGWGTCLWGTTKMLTETQS